MLNITNDPGSDGKTPANVRSKNGEMHARPLGGAKLQWCQSCKQRPAIFTVRSPGLYAGVIIVCWECCP